MAEHGARRRIVGGGRQPLLGAVQDALVDLIYEAVPNKSTKKTPSDSWRQIPGSTTSCPGTIYRFFLEEHKPKMNRERIILMDETVVYCEDARAYTVDDVGARHVVVRSTGFASLRITVMAVTATGKKLPPCLIWKRKYRGSNERLGG
ncbi:hypothetical protein L914_18829 [Phytophthora nicotianae]|nr:hypothetical protein L914_18829 [Phytophthora nicotianae]